jgi:outer membrane protein insertion porin family
LNFYRNQGVRGTDIRAAVEMVDEDRFNVEFQIREGKRVVIQDIVISGHQVTRLSTITRELRINRGDLARYEAIRESKRRLENLGIFSEVRIEEIQLSPESMNLFIRLNEGQRNYLSAGLGLETATAPESVDVWNEDVRLRGTGEVMRGNLFGSAAQLSLVGQLSIRERRVVASWQQPYFFRVPMKTYLSSWWEQEERTSFQYERQGISLSGIRAFGGNQDWTLITSLRYARTKLLELEIEENEIDRQFFPYSTTSLEGSVIRDRRDDPFNPTSGYFFSTALEWAYPLFDVESDFLKLFAKYQHYIPIRKDVLFSFTTRLGLGSGRMPIPERFFAGGSNSFRGTRYDQLGPDDPISGKPVGGKALFLVNFELVVPIFPQLQYLNALLFYDKGNVFARRAEFSIRSLADALGIGLRYRTPLGPVRLELGWNPGARPGQSKTMVFITIGNIF